MVPVLRVCPTVYPTQAEFCLSKSGSEDQWEEPNCVCLLSVPQVHCVGHLVCAVIAESETQARRAAKQVKVVYQDLEPPILTIEVWGQADGGRLGARVLV